MKALRGYLGKRSARHLRRIEFLRVNPMDYAKAPRAVQFQCQNKGLQIKKSI